MRRLVRPMSMMVFGVVRSSERASDAKLWARVSKEVRYSFPLVLILFLLFFLRLWFAV